MRVVNTLVLFAVIAGIAVLLIISKAPEEAARGPADAPAPPPTTRERDADLPSTRDVAENVTVQLPETVGPSTGTAFTVAPGVWLTARHVVDGCSRTILAVRGFEGVEVTEAILAEDADVAMLRAALPATAVPLTTSAQPPRVGSDAYHVGYPQARAGEVVSRYFGPATLQIRGRYLATAPAGAYVEQARTPGLTGTLGGISGGPVFDENGVVIGATVAENPRRGRIYTAVPSSLRSTLQTGAASADPGAPSAGGFSMESFMDVAQDLRQTFRVAKVFCQTDG